MAEMRVLMAHIDNPDQMQIETYEKNGGYQAIRKAIPHIAPQISPRWSNSRASRPRRGRFFYRNEMGICPKRSSLPKYLVCNCDESEPGTFKDRLLIEKDPHQLIEGMILASYAIGAQHAFIYCRGEYFEGFANRLREPYKRPKSEAIWDRIILAPTFLWRLLSIQEPEPISPEKRRRCSTLGRISGHTPPKAPFSCCCRPLWQADHHQQCRNPLQCRPYRQPGCRMVSENRKAKKYRNKNFSGQRPCAASRLL